MIKVSLKLERYLEGKVITYIRHATSLLMGEPQYGRSSLPNKLSKLPELFVLLNPSPFPAKVPSAAGMQLHGGS